MLGDSTLPLSSAGVTCREGHGMRVHSFSRSQLSGGDPFGSGLAGIWTHQLDWPRISSYGAVSFFTPISMASMLHWVGFVCSRIRKRLTSATNMYVKQKWSCVGMPSDCPVIWRAFFGAHCGQRLGVEPSTKCLLSSVDFFALVTYCILPRS